MGSSATVRVHHGGRDRTLRVRAEVPLHPSYEDRPGAPDRVYAALGDDVVEVDLTGEVKVVKTVTDTYQARSVILATGSVKKPIPGTDRLVAIFSPGHGNREHAGAVMVVDPKAGPDDPRRARRISPEVPLANGWMGGRDGFRDPVALAPDLFLAAKDKSLFVLDDREHAEEIYQAAEMIHERVPECHVIVLSGEEDEQILMLQATLAEMPRLVNMIDDMMDAWLAGTPEALADLFLAEMGAYGEGFMDRLIVQRNRNWVVQIEDMLERDEKAFASTGGWGFEGFKGNSRDRIVSDPQSCFSCHQRQAAATGFVFSSWRP